MEGTVENTMNYELFTLIFGFMGLALIVGRNSLKLTERMEQMRKETNQRLEELQKDTNQRLEELRKKIDARFDQIQTETGQRIESMREEMSQFRTEMNRRFDEANIEMNRRFDTISHDVADLRERMARVEENLKTGEARNKSAA